MRKSKKEMPLYESMRWTNNMLMVTAAHRYCLGRETYIVGSCIEWLTEIWWIIDKNTQNVIMRDTIAALMDGEAGSPYIDEPAWRKFCEESWVRISQEQRTWIEDALRHKDKPWPWKRA